MFQLSVCMHGLCVAGFPFPQQLHYRSHPVMHQRAKPWRTIALWIGNDQKPTPSRRPVRCAARVEGEHEGRGGGDEGKDKCHKGVNSCCAGAGADCGKAVSLAAKCWVGTAAPRALERREMRELRRSTCSGERKGQSPLPNRQREGRKTQKTRHE